MKGNKISVLLIVLALCVIVYLIYRTYKNAQIQHQTTDLLVDESKNTVKDMNKYFGINGQFEQEYQAAVNADQLYTVGGLTNFYSTILKIFG